MRIPCTIALFGLISIGSFSAAVGAGVQEFRVEDVAGAGNLGLAELKPGTIAFSDQQSSASGGDPTKLIGFEEWARKQPGQKKFLSLFPGYIEPTVTKVAERGRDRVPRLLKSLRCTSLRRVLFSTAHPALSIYRTM